MAIKIACTDTVGKTKGIHKWTLRAKKELEKLGRCTTFTAGLETVECGLVIGAVGVSNGIHACGCAV